MLNKLIDILQFRQTGDFDNETDQPVVTTGSVVWGVLLRSAILIVASFVILDRFQLREYWWMLLFAMWFLVFYPAYRQYQMYNKRIKDLEEDTLCGSCKHFDQSGQLCRLYDQHISRNHIPCEGNDWEPTTFEL